MKKIVFCDIDKTLCLKNTISSLNKEKINKYINLGGYFILVSGRGVKYTKEIAKEIEGIRYIICNNGAIGYDIKENKVIYKLPIKSKPYNKLCMLAKNFDCSFIINTTNEMYAKGYYTKDNIYTKANDIYDDLYNKYDVMQLVLSCTEKEDTKKIIKEVEKLKSIKIINRHRSLYDDTYPEKNNIWIDITAKKVDKGYGVKRLAKYLNIPFKDTVRIGDDLNDMPMFFNKGVNIAVDNAIPNLKKKADIIAPSCENDGVAKVLEDIINERI